MEFPWALEEVLDCVKDSSLDFVGYVCVACVY